MVIFTSLKSNDINITENSSRGVQSFKAFLKYIENGTENKIVNFAEDTKDNSFQESIVNLLSQYGYETVTNLGVSGVFIDIAVKSIKNPNDFILAIECEGKHKNLRDSDRLTKNTLKKLGWTLYNIWTVDWYKNRENEVNKLIDTIKEAQENYKGKVLETPTMITNSISDDINEVDDGSDCIIEINNNNELNVSSIENIDIDDDSENNLAKNIFLSDSEIKEKLIELRDNKIAKEFLIDRRSILSDFMIELFIKYKPLDIDDFRNKIPLRYRNDNVINIDQMKYINDIFDILDLGD